MKLSLQTVKELVELGKNFELGCRVEINTDDNEINITGYGALNERGNIGIVRSYDVSYIEKNGEIEFDTDGEIYPLDRDTKVLKKANLYECYEDTKEKMEEENELG